MRNKLPFFTFLFIAFVIKGYSGTISYSEMLATYGKNKTIIKEVEVPTIIALSVYPELKNVSIRFEYKSIATTMSTLPDIKSVFDSKRAYVIYINSDASKKGGVSYKELNLKQQVGIIAHELAHVLYLEKKSNLSILSSGLMYLCSSNYHMNLEKETDITVINRGLGEELYAFSNFVINQSNASANYIAFKKKNYLLPEEIKQRMK